MKSSNPVTRINEIFSSTIDSDLSYSGPLTEMNYYNLLFKATTENKLYKMFSCNLCMFNYKYEGVDSVLILFAIPVSVNTEVVADSKHFSERMMDILKILEECFITLDFIHSQDVKEEKFIYLVAIKKLNNKEK